MAFALALAAAGAGLAAWQQKQANDRAKDVAKANQNRLDRQAEDEQAASIDRRQAAHSEQVSLTGQLLNSLGNRSESKGRLSQAIAKDAQRDAGAERINQKNIARSIEAAKLNERLGAPVGSVGIAAVQGGLQGYSMGQNIQSSFKARAQQQEFNKAMKDPNTSSVQKRALLNGVPPTMINDPDVLAPYEAQDEVSQLKLQAAKVNLQTARQNQMRSLVNLWMFR